MSLLAALDALGLGLALWLAVAGLGLAQVADVDRLLAQLESSDPATRRAAAQALGAVGARNAVPALLKALGSADAALACEVVRSLGRIGDASALPSLVEALGHRDERVRMLAADALAQLGAESEAAVGALARAARQDVSLYVREAAIGALGRLGRAARSAVPALVETLGHESDYLRLAAVNALGRIGPAASAALPALRAARDEAESRLARLTAERSRVASGPQRDTGEEDLVEAQVEEQEQLRRAIAEALSRIETLPRASPSPLPRRRHPSPSALAGVGPRHATKRRSRAQAITRSVVAHPASGAAETPPAGLDPP